MPQCYVTTCSNYYERTRSTSKVIYHMFPSSSSLAQKWAKLCGHKDVLPPSYTRICSEHFSSNAYKRDLQHELLGLPLRKKLKPSAVPDQNLPNLNEIERKNKSENVGEIIVSNCEFEFSQGNVHVRTINSR